MTKKKATIDITQLKSGDQKIHKREKLNKFKHKLVIRNKYKPKRPYTYTDTNNRNTKQHYTNNMDTTYMKYSNKMKPSVNVQAWKMLNSDNSFAYFSTLTLLSMYNSL